MSPPLPVFALARVLSCLLSLSFLSPVCSKDSRRDQTVAGKVAVWPVLQRHHQDTFHFGVNDSQLVPAQQQLPGPLTAVL